MKQKINLSCGIKERLCAYCFGVYGCSFDDICEHQLPLRRVRKIYTNILQKPLDCEGVDFKRQKGKIDEDNILL